MSSTPTHVPGECARCGRPVPVAACDPANTEMVCCDPCTTTVLQDLHQQPKLTGAEKAAPALPKPGSRWVSSTGTRWVITTVRAGMIYAAYADQYDWLTAHRKRIRGTRVAGRRVGVLPHDPRTRSHPGAPVSYARSSESGSDVYVFCSGATWETHVAYGRIDPAFPQPRWDAPAAQQVAWLEHPLLPIGPLDGQSYYDDTPGACADRLEWLREQGYGVPQHAIDRLRSEASEEPHRG